MTPSRSFWLATALLASAVLSKPNLHAARFDQLLSRPRRPYHRQHGERDGHWASPFSMPQAKHALQQQRKLRMRKQVDLNSTHLDFFIRAAAAAAPPARRFGFGFPVARSPKVSLGPCDR